jgi:branched-chain amino acid transport system substrate-binding protein
MKGKRLVTALGLSLLLILAMLIAIAPGLQAAPGSEKTLAIGALYSVTGVGSEVEAPMRDAVMLFKDSVNKQGGITIKGEKYKLDVIHEDTRGTLDGAVAAATKLVHQDKVNFIVGQMIPDQVFAVTKITEPAKVIRSISWGGGIPGQISDKTPYTFIAVLGGAMVIPTSFQYLVDAYPHVKTIALSSPDDAGGRFFISFAKKAAEERGLKVVSQEFAFLGLQDFDPIMDKIISSKPDAIDCGGGYTAGAASQLLSTRQLGFKGPIFTSTSAFDLNAILSIVGPEVANNYFNGFLDYDSPDAPKKVVEIKNLWSATYKKPFMYELLFGWDSIWTLVQAIQKAQSLDPTMVAKTWEKMQGIETTHGLGHMGGLQTYGTNHVVVRPCYISGLVNGKVKILKSYTPKIP